MCVGLGWCKVLRIRVGEVWIARSEGDVVNREGREIGKIATLSCYIFETLEMGSD